MPNAAAGAGIRDARRAADLRCMAALGVLWVVMAILANPIGDFPINDDWVYGLSVKALLDTGRFSLPSPASANLLPQAYWGALFCLPFGFSFTALRISTLVLGLIGVWMTYATARELSADRPIAFLAAALVAVNPVYFALANTFMTDVPFYAVPSRRSTSSCAGRSICSGATALIGPRAVDDRDPDPAGRHRASRRASRSPTSSFAG
jgi:hypothetical protein